MRFQFCPSVERYDKAYKRIHQAKAVNRLIFLKWVSRAIILMRTWKSNSSYLGFLRILKVLQTEKLHGFLIDPMGILKRRNLHVQNSIFFLHVVCIDLFKFLGHLITYCPTCSGVANLLTALVVRKLANLEANLGALAICSCTFEIIWKATWLMCSKIFHLIWRFAWKHHFSL